MRYGSRVSYAFVRQNVCIQSWMLLYSFESCLQRAENFTPTNFNKVFKFVNLSLFGMKSFSSISNFNVIYEAIKTAIKSEKIPSIGKKTCGIDQPWSKDDEMLAKFLRLLKSTNTHTNKKERGQYLTISPSKRGRKFAKFKSHTVI